MANSLAKERSEGRGKRRDREKVRGERGGRGRVDGGDATALGGRSNPSRPARPPDLVPCSFSLPLPPSLPPPPLCIPFGRPRPKGRPKQEPKLFCNHDEKVVLIKSDVVRLRRTENATHCHKCNRTGTQAKIITLFVLIPGTRCDSHLAYFVQHCDAS